MKLFFNKNNVIYKEWEKQRVNKSISMQAKTPKPTKRKVKRNTFLKGG